MAQTSYNLYQGIGYEGQIADPGERYVESRVAEAAVEFGHAVKKGTVTGSCITASATGDTIVGVSVRTQAIENAFKTGGAKYATGDVVSVLTSGHIYVSPIAAVDDGDDVYFVHATGLFSNAAGSGATAATKIVGWAFKSKCDAGGIAVMEVK